MVPERIRRTIAAAVTIVWSGCQSPSTPTAPPDHDARSLVLRAPVCAVAQVNVQCSVSVWIQGQGDQNVTAFAQWTASSDPFSILPTSIAVVISPGTFAPASSGEIYVQVDYLGMHTVAPHSYAVAPDRPAVALAPYLTGTVFEGPGVTTTVDGVRVEIVGGDPGPDHADTTRNNGAYFIRHVRMGVPLTVTASKAGYETAVETHPGIVDDSLGYPSNNLLHFHLTRLSP